MSSGSPSVRPDGKPTIPRGKSAYGSAREAVLTILALFPHHSGSGVSNAGNKKAPERGL